jgi:hypothetical protein
VPPQNDGDAGADADAAAVQPDPSGGRDDSPASCYAACQNGAFTCQTKGDPGAAILNAELTPDANGCAGTLTTASASPSEQSVALQIDCKAVTVCRGDAPGQPATTCAAGTFSAFSFAYRQGAATVATVCTRN